MTFGDSRSLSLKFKLYYRDVPKTKEIENAMNRSQMISLRNFTIPGLIHSYRKVQEREVDYEMINTLSDGELTRLGVATTGDRHRLKRRYTEETEKQQVNIILIP